MRSSVILLALLSFAADARGGGAVRVTKLNRPLKSRMYWVEFQPNQAQTQAIVYAVPAELAVGEEYDVIDSQGYIGRIRINTVEDAYPQYKSLELKKGVATFLSPPSRGGASDMVAFGPNARAPLRAKVFMQAPTGDKPPDQPDGQLYQRTFMDLDGDGASDLVRDAYSCVPTGTGAGVTTYCYDTWSRWRSGGWSRVSHATLKYN